MSAKLIFLCGKMAAGKSTLSRQLAEREDAVLLVQDEWLEPLYPREIVDVATYIDRQMAGAYGKGDALDDCD